MGITGERRWGGGSQLGQAWGQFEGCGGLTQRLHDHAWNHVLQDFTVGVQSGVAVHLQKPHLGQILVSIPPQPPLGQEEAEDLAVVRPGDPGQVASFLRPHSPYLPKGLRL